MNFVYFYFLILDKTLCFVVKKIIKYQEKILLAIILNSEDEMTLEDN